MTLTAALLIIAATVYLMVRRGEVRLVLFSSGLLMATLAGKPLAVFDKFTDAMVAAMVAPICAAMGFAAVLSLTGCDRHLVLLLLAPLRRAPWLIIPGGILVAYLINLAVPSQASTAAALGPVLVPLMLAAGVPPEVAGAALILGASIGGDLLHAAPQDVVALSGVTGVELRAISARVAPASLAGVLVAAAVFALLNRRSRCAVGDSVRQKETRDPHPIIPGVMVTSTGTQPSSGTWDSPEKTSLNPVKALIPLFPVALLLLANTGWSPLAWLRGVPEGEGWERLKDALPVVRAMLLGTFLAALVCWRQAQEVVRGLFDGMGLAYGSIISLTITAQCFGAGIKALGVSAALLAAASLVPGALTVLAAAFPWALATLGGSGSGAVLTFGETFLAPISHRPDVPALAAVACLTGAFGRTMSPVAAVVVYTAGLVGVSPLLLVRRLLPALLSGAAVSLAVALLAG